MHDKIYSLLNEQIRLELESSFIYLNMATWSEINKYEGAAHFLYSQSEEEKQHMMKIIRYLTQLNQQPLIPSIPSQAANYPSLKSIFQKSLQHEKKITQSIQKIADSALSLKDYTTLNFIQWFIEEQLEEETTAHKIMDLFDLIPDDNGFNLYTIDKEIRELSNEKNNNG